MEFQHVNVKLFVEDGEKVDLEVLIPVFHSWIQNQAAGELLLDVADYRHIRSGPGVILIGHEGNYSLDNTGGRLGVRYNRKAALEGTNQDRLAQATHAALAACRRLETEPRLGGTIRFNGCELEVLINDRLLAPNTRETRPATDSEFRTFFSTLFGDIEYAASYPLDPRSLFSLHVKASQALDTAALLNNLNSMAPVSHQG
jgi:hypothetical protein